MLSLTDSGSQFQVGQTLHAQFKLADNDGSATVHLFLDNDQNPYNDIEYSVTGNLSYTGMAAGYVYNPANPVNLTTTGVAAGQYYLVAAITDGLQVRFAYFSTPITLTNPPATTSGSTLILNYSSPTSLSLVASGTNLIVIQGSNTYPFATSGISAILVNLSSGADSLTLSGSISRPITFSSNPSGTLSLILDSTASASLASPTTSGAPPLLLTALSIASGGRLNLNGNSLILDYSGTSPIDTLRSYLFSGRAGGAWNGSGLISSSPLGYFEATDLGRSSFAGQAVDSTTLIVTPALPGDANLDGQVNADDYALTDRAFARNISNPHWTSADFDYSGSLNANDYLLLDSSAAAASSPSLLALRLATFGPDYLLTLTENRPLSNTTSLATSSPTPPAAISTFSSHPITETQAKSLPLSSLLPASPVSLFSAPSPTLTDQLIQDGLL